MAAETVNDELDFEDINFDPSDEVSYYYGNLNRDDVKDILNDASIGTFLIRDSTKDYDQKVLCVKEAPKSINNYKIIHKLISKSDEESVKNIDKKMPKSSPSKQSSTNTELTNEGEKIHVFYLYGKEDCLFSSIAKILEFYSTHYLNQSPLVKPAFYHKKVITLYDFQESEDPSEDLYFKKDDILSILEYTQGEHWWKASNESNKTGLIPATLVRRLKPILKLKKNEWPLKKMNNIKTVAKEIKQSEIKEVVERAEEPTLDDEEANQSTFTARVIEDYTPSPYEHSHISLRKGQIVTVLEMKSMGKWMGQLADGKKGLFPFNRVELIE